MKESAKESVRKHLLIQASKLSMQLNLLEKDDNTNYKRDELLEKMDEMKVLFRALANSDILK